jgi:hypothetical protein
MRTDNREEIAASVAAHLDLGPRYDQAVAEGLVERIGDEIDKRVAAELDRSLDVQRRRPGRRPWAARQRGPSVLLAFGSMGLAIAATSIVMASGTASSESGGAVTRSGPGTGSLVLTALIWIVIGVINVAHVISTSSTRRHSG